MAKKSKIAKDAQRRRIVARYAERRADLKRRSVDFSLPDAEREAAMAALHALPRDASPIRLRNRCRLTGRPHGFYRKFGLGRNKLREATMRGDVPGLRKASW